MYFAVMCFAVNEVQNFTVFLFIGLFCSFTGNWRERETERNCSFVDIDKLDLREAMRAMGQVENEGVSRVCLICLEYRDNMAGQLVILYTYVLVGKL